MFAAESCLVATRAWPEYRSVTPGSGEQLKCRKSISARAGQMSQKQFFLERLSRIIDRKVHILLSLSKRPEQRPSLRLSSPRYKAEAWNEWFGWSKLLSLDHDPRFLAPNNVYSRLC
jgi:hypothetical protein